MYRGFYALVRFTHASAKRCVPLWLRCEVVWCGIVSGTAFIGGAVRVGGCICLLALTCRVAACVL